MKRNGLYSTSKFSVNRTDYIYSKSTGGLRVARLIIGILIILLIVGTVTVGIWVYSPSENRKNSEKLTEAELNGELIRVVNKSNPLDRDFVPELTEVNGVKVSVLCADFLTELLSAAKSDGVDLQLKEGYISYSAQQKRYNKLFKSLLSSGEYTEVRAQAKAERIVPQAGRSEAQTGLLITFKTSQKGSFKNSAAAAWLTEHCIDYGFVRRYPADKTAETSMDARYTIYRFVGRENASVMRSLNKSLDEYSVYVNSR